MDFILGALGLGALALVIYGIQTGVDRTGSAIDKKLRGGRLASDREELHGGLEFTAPVATEKVIDAILRVVNAHDNPPPVVQGLFVNSRTPQGIEFAVGNRFEVIMTASVLAWPADNGSEGACTIGTWSEHGAQVFGLTEFRRILERVRTAVAEVGGTVREVPGSASSATDSQREDEDRRTNGVGSATDGTMKASPPFESEHAVREQVYGALAAGTSTEAVLDQWARWLVAGSVTYDQRKLAQAFATEGVPPQWTPGNASTSASSPEGATEEPLRDSRQEQRQPPFSSDDDVVLSVNEGLESGVGAAQLLHDWDTWLRRGLVTYDQRKVARSHLL